MLQESLEQDRVREEALAEERRAAEEAQRAAHEEEARIRHALGSPTLLLLLPAWFFSAASVACAISGIDLVYILELPRNSLGGVAQCLTGTSDADWIRRAEEEAEAQRQRDFVSSLENRRNKASTSPPPPPPPPPSTPAMVVVVALPRPGAHHQCIRCG